MISVAFKMLVGNKASFLGVIFGIFLALLLISQQSAIFLGLVSRSYRMVTDMPLPNLWVIDSATQGEDTIRRMPEGYLDFVRSVPGVEWAVPINFMNIPLVTKKGDFQIAQIYGIDDETLIGGPIEMIEGRVRDLQREGAVIVDVLSANSSLATTLPDGTIEPLKIGDSLEINQHRAVVVGICKITPGFYPQPILFVTNSQFNYFNGFATNRIGYIAAKTTPGVNENTVIAQINPHLVLEALTRQQFKNKISDHFLKTGILINFGLSVVLGLIIGFSIAGQIFYIMTLNNINYFALMKALGGTHLMIFKMITFQALLTGAIGYLLGTGATLLWGMAIKDTTLAFLFPWQLLLFTGVITLLICLFTVALSVRKIYRLNPQVLMGS